MTSRLIRLAAFAFIILGINSSTASAQSAPALTVPPVPDTLQVPAGYTLFLGTRECRRRRTPHRISTR